MGMKLGVAAIGAALLLAACGREDQELERERAGAMAPTPVTVAAVPARAAAPVAAGDRQLLDAWLAAWNAHDMQAVANLMADDIEYFDAGFSGIQRGRNAAMEQGVSVFMRGVPDLHWALRGEPIVGADAIAWEWTFTGTNTGTWGGIPATRQQIQLKGVSVMRLRAGKVAGVATYYDSGSLNRQLGL